MNYFLLLFICIIPSLFLLSYVYTKDSIEKEPIPLLTVFFVGGIVACAGSVLMQSLFKELWPFLNLPYSKLNILQILFKTLVTIAFIEELFKWCLLFLVSFRDKNFNYPYDGIVYGVFVSLGFATYENVLYAFAYIDEWLLPLLLRGVISIPIHLAFGVFMGYFLSLAKSTRKKKDKKKYKVLSFLVPLSFHFIYDLCLVKHNNLSMIMFIMYVIILIAYSYTIIEDTSKMTFKKKK